MIKGLKLVWGMRVGINLPPTSSKDLERIQTPQINCRTIELELVKSSDGFLIYRTELAEICSLKPVASASFRRKREAAQALEMIK